MGHELATLMSRAEFLRFAGNFPVAANLPNYTQTVLSLLEGAYRLSGGDMGSPEDLNGYVPSGESPALGDPRPLVVDLGKSNFSAYVVKVTDKEAGFRQMESYGTMPRTYQEILNGLNEGTRKRVFVQVQSKSSGLLSRPKSETELVEALRTIEVAYVAIDDVGDKVLLIGRGDDRYLARASGTAAEGGQIRAGQEVYYCVKSRLKDIPANAWGGNAIWYINWYFKTHKNPYDLLSHPPVMIAAKLQDKRDAPWYNSRPNDTAYVFPRGDSSGPIPDTRSWFYDLTKGRTIWDRVRDITDTVQKAGEPLDEQNSHLYVDAHPLLIVEVSGRKIYTFPDVRKFSFIENRGKIRLPIGTAVLVKGFIRIENPQFAGWGVVAELTDDTLSSLTYNRSHSGQLAIVALDDLKWRIIPAPKK